MYVVETTFLFVGKAILVKNDGGRLVDGMESVDSVDKKDQRDNVHLSLISTVFISSRRAIQRLTGILHCIHWFNYVFAAITLLMLVGGAYVLYVAFNRSSGSSGIDAGKLTEMRFDANLTRQV